MANTKDNSSGDKPLFLGYEFLTWLFLLLDRENAADDTKKILGDKANVVLGNKMVTCLLNHREQKTSVASPLLEDSHEVFASLRNGHLCESLALSVNFAEISVNFVIHAEDFAFTQLKIKSNFGNDMNNEENTLSEADKNREEVFLRMAAVENTEQVVDTIYEHFLTIRLEPKKFADELIFMRKQIEGRLADYLQKNRAVSFDESLIGENP